MHVLLQDLRLDESYNIVEKEQEACGAVEDPKGLDESLKEGGRVLMPLRPDNKISQCLFLSRFEEMKMRFVHLGFAI